MFFAEWIARLGAQDKTCVVAIDRDARPDERLLVRVRPAIRVLGASTLVVVTRHGLYAFGADSDVGAREVQTETEVDPERRVLLVDRHGALRFGYDASDALTLAAAIEDCAERAPSDVRVSRRRLVVATVASGFAMMATSCGPSEKKVQDPSTTSSRAVPSTEIDVALEVNGRSEKLHVDPRVTLLDALRDRLGLVGTKMGCDMGQCGACTVLVDGHRVVSCLTLAAMADGKKITTIEGLAKGDVLHPMQAAFAAEDAFQCGFCTPGQIMSAVGLLAEGHVSSDDDVREAMSGNICRCGAYPNIVRAVQRVRKGA